MEIESAKFIISNSEFENLPAPSLPEYAFIGRSNVGKSSLINTITKQKKLAKTSSTPGKTQLINHFLINDNWYLVDLPGYGYAKSSKKERKEWKRMIDNYLISRENLLCTFILLDSRHTFQKLDLEFMTWMATKGLPFALVFTKSDKLGQHKLALSIKHLKIQILEHWEELPPHFLSSAEKGFGAEEILSFIEDANELFVKTEA